MDRRVSAWSSVVLATVCAVVGWIAIGAVELGANNSLDEVDAALISVETSLTRSTGVALATADALDAAASSVDDASAGSSATADVASEVADVTGTLPPVLEDVAGGIDQVNITVDELNKLLDSVPFLVGGDVRLQTFDPISTDIDPLLEDLRTAEASLDRLALRARDVEGSSSNLSEELRKVSSELRASVDEIEILAADVADTRSTIDASNDAAVDLLIAQLVIVGLAASIIIGALPDLVPRSDPAEGADRVGTSDGFDRPDNS